MEFTGVYYISLLDFGTITVEGFVENLEHATTSTHPLGNLLQAVKAVKTDIKVLQQCLVFRVLYRILSDIVIPSDHKEMVYIHRFPWSLILSSSLSLLCSCVRISFSLSGIGRPMWAAFSISERPSLLK